MFSLFFNTFQLISILFGDDFEETGDSVGLLLPAERFDRRVVGFAPRVDIDLEADVGAETDALLPLLLLTRVNAFGVELALTLPELVDDDKDFFGLLSFLSLLGLIFFINSFSSTFPTTETSTPSAVTLIGSGLSLIP